VTEWIIAINEDEKLYKNESYNIDNEVKVSRGFHQSLVRSGKLVKCKMGDIVFIYITNPKYEIRYIAEIAKVSRKIDDPCAFLEVTHKYESPVPRSALEEKGYVKKKSRCHWNIVNGLDNAIEKEGTYKKIKI
jgi:hypothetical protein